MVFNLYNPYCTMVDGRAPFDVTKNNKDGIPAAYDNGAQALNQVIEKVCSDDSNPAHVMDAYTACNALKTGGYTSADFLYDFALQANWIYQWEDSSSQYYGVEAFYPRYYGSKAIASAVNETELPDGKGWPEVLDGGATPQHSYPGILVASTLYGRWSMNFHEGNKDYKNTWGAYLNLNQGAVTSQPNYLNLMGTWLAPKDARNGYDGPFLSQDRYWKTTGGLLDFDSGSETYFEDWNIWMEKDNATLSLRDVQLEAETNCLNINANVSDIFGEGNDTLNIALTGSNSFHSIRASSAILTDGTGNLRFTGEGSLELTNSGSAVFSNYVISMPNGGLSIAEDTGGAIRKNRIDLYYYTYEECIQFGVRDCTVYILDNVSNAILSHDKLGQYRPQFSVNEDNAWMHVRGKKKK